MSKHSLTLAATIVILGAAGYWMFRPFDMVPGLLSSDSATEIAELCEKTLAPLIEPDVYAGANVPGSPEHVIANYDKFLSRGVLDWIGMRSDIRLTVSYSDKGDDCAIYDKHGYVIGTYGRSHRTFGSTWRLRWMTSRMHNGRKEFVQYRLDSTSPDGKSKADWPLGLDQGKNQVTVRNPAEKNPEKLGVMASYSMNDLTGRLTLEILRRSRLVVEKNGLLSEHYSRPCYDPDDEPCPHIWDSIHHTYDDHGNLIARDIDNPTDGSGKHRDELVIELNDRGDWISWHFSQLTDEIYITRRIVVYRD